MVSQCNVYFILPWLLGDFVAAKARQGESNAAERLLRFFWIEERDLFNENIAREKRLRGNIYSSREARGASHTKGPSSYKRPYWFFR